MVPFSHPPIVANSQHYDLKHLDAFEAVLIGKGVTDGSDLPVHVCFSNHVVTERSKHGDPRHVQDHNGTWRYFDTDRYRMSQSLPALLQAAIVKNDLTFVSRSFGGIDNLILLHMNGATWAIVFCFQPTEDGVRMEILSSHPKNPNQRKVSRKPISFFARKCIFEKERIPRI